MKPIESLKKIWLRSGKSLRLLLCVSMVLLVILISYSCIRAGARKDRPDAHAAAEIDQAGSGREIAGGEAELPDLAETIARLSRQISDPAWISDPGRISDPDREAFIEDFWRWIFGEAGLPERLARQVASSALEGPAFIMELLGVLNQDPYTYRLVDKQHGLPLDYEPDDLVRLESGLYRISRNDLALRRIVPAYAV